MRTKTLLLMAAALLAAGIASTQAQPVYSQNIVGYASVATPQSGTYYMLTVPFSMGVSNGANEVFGSTLPDFTTLLTWNVASQSFNVVQVFSGSATGWADAGFNPVPAPVLAVGKGFFLNPSANNLTNTFAGTIAINVGTSNQMTLTNSGTYYMVGSVVPYAGFVTNGNKSTGGPNLNAVPDFSTVLTWNAASQSYVTVQAFSGSSTGWADAGFNQVPPPTLTVGQGFMINLSTGPYTWTTGL